MGEMIVSDTQGHQVEGGEGAQYVQFEAASGDDGSGEEGEAQQVIVTTGADGQQTTSINGKNYVVVTTDGENGEKQTVLVAADEAHEHTGTGVPSMIVQEMMTDPEAEAEATNQETAAGQQEDLSANSLESKAEVAAAVAAAAAEATQVRGEPEAMEEQTELISAEQGTTHQAAADETAWAFYS